MQPPIIIPISRQTNYNCIFYSNIQKKLRFLHNLNQFAKDIVQNCTKSLKFHLKHKCFDRILIIRSFICLGFSPDILF